MNPTNVDAYVARGAAHANQKQLLAAIKDFQHALDLDGQNVNAAKYLEATQQHLQQHDAKHQTRSSPDASNHNRQQPPSSRRHQHNHHAVQPAAAGVGSQHQVHVRDHVSAALKVPAAAADGSGRAANVKSKDDSARSGQQRSPTGTASPSSYDSSDASSANASEGVCLHAGSKAENNALPSTLPIANWQIDSPLTCHQTYADNSPAILCHVLL